MIKIIQISDFHYVDSTVQKMMMAKTTDLFRKINPDMLFITGDLHNFGNDYEPFKLYIRELMEQGNLDGMDVFVVPGNHDVDDKITEGTDKNRKAYIGYICGQAEEDADCYKDYRDELLSYFKGFNKTISEVTDNAYTPGAVCQYTWKDKVNVITLNTALISDGKDHSQIIDVDALTDINPCNGLPTIIIGHHDISCLFDSHQSILKSYMAMWKISLYACGDRHRNKQGLVDDVMCDNIKIPVIVAGKSSAENGDDYSDISCLVYEIDDENETIQLSLFKWSETRKCFEHSGFDNKGEFKQTYNFDLRKSPKKNGKVANRRAEATNLTLYSKKKSRNDSAMERYVDKWVPPVVQGYVLIGTQGREGIKYVWRSGEMVFESIALNQKQSGNLRGDQDTSISTYATSVSCGCLLKSMGKECSFCESGRIPFGRLLTFQEIALQNIFMSIYDDDCECHAYLKENSREFSYTAQGEPGYSYSQIRKAILLTEKILTKDKRDDFITRHVIYTCGVTDFFDSLASDVNNHVFKRPVCLHISLNAIGSERRAIMPIDVDYPYKQVLHDGKALYEKTNGKIGKIVINLIAFNKYEHEGRTLTIDEENVKTILSEIGDHNIFRINVYDHYSEKNIANNKGNERIERLYKAIEAEGYEVKACHCWGERVNSAFGMLNASTIGLSDLGHDGCRNYDKAIQLIEENMQHLF